MTDDQGQQKTVTLEVFRYAAPDILVTDPDMGPDLAVRSGVVAAHSKDREEVDRKALELRPRRSARSACSCHVVHGVACPVQSP